MKCSAHRQDGHPCKALAIKGGTVCRVHGGSAPQVRQAANRRLLEAIDPAAVELIRIALHGVTERDRLTAIKELFERAGFGSAKRVEVEGGLSIQINGVDIKDLR
jgi:hypothetical protein